MFINDNFVLKNKGLGKPAKRRMMKETIIGAKADIVCLNETKLRLQQPA